MVEHQWDEVAGVEEVPRQVEVRHALRGTAKAGQEAVAPLHESRAGGMEESGGGGADEEGLEGGIHCGCVWDLCPSVHPIPGYK